MGFGKDGKLSILYDWGFAFVLDSLAAHDVSAGAGRYVNLLIDDFRMIKVKYQAMLEGNEAGDSVLFGIADADLSSAEIESCLEGAWVEESDRVNEEFAGRPVWPLGHVHILGGGDPTFAQGEFSEEVIRWTFHQSSGWQWWAYNPALASALGTATDINIFAKIYGVWVR